MDDLKGKKLGFLGLGAMGFPICYGLVESGYSVKVPAWRRESCVRHGFCPIARDPEEKARAFDRMLARGAVAASSQCELLEGLDFLVLCLPTSAQVEEVLTGPDGALSVCRPGLTVIDCTSGDFAATRRLAGVLEDHGMNLLDAPVSGGTGGAAAQTVAVMCGGREEVFEACRPILETIGDPKKLVYLGPSGSGDLVKSANNFISAAANAAVSEALSVIAAAGIDPRLAAQVIAVSSGRCAAVEEKFPKVVFPGGQWNFTAALMSKDLGLFTSAARGMNVPAPVSNLTSELFRIAMTREGRDADVSCISRMYGDWAGATLYGRYKGQKNEG